MWAPSDSGKPWIWPSEIKKIKKKEYINIDIKIKIIYKLFPHKLFGLVVLQLRDTATP